MIDFKIKALIFKWESWAEEKCKGLDEIYKDAYYYLAAQVCIDGIKQILKLNK